jgi:hypothetical protein
MTGIFLERLHILCNVDSLLTKYLLGALFMGACFWAWRWDRVRDLWASRRSEELDVIKRQPAITPLKDFHWASTEPLQLRPFRGKVKYNLTMGGIIFTAYQYDRLHANLYYSY